jgi:hypothetical protein
MRSGARYLPGLQELPLPPWKYLTYPPNLGMFATGEIGFSLDRTLKGWRMKSERWGHGPANS